MIDNKDKDYWENRWQNADTSWDIGFASPAIVKYMETFSNKDATILIAGCGNAYEAEFLLNKGFTNITLIDIAPNAVKILTKKFNQNKEINVLCGDFFSHQGKYDLMIEQTFFCAINPNLRPEYVSKSHELLSENGKIMGLMFNTHFIHDGPPFGGSVNEYEALFQDFFTIEKMEICYNSIPPRQGREVFVELIKK